MVTRHRFDGSRGLRRAKGGGQFWGVDAGAQNQVDWLSNYHVSDIPVSASYRSFKARS